MTSLFAKPQPHVLSGTHWPLLGTVVDIRVTANIPADAARAEQIVCDEIARLEQIFSVYNDESLLRRWIANPTTPTCPEFDDLLSTALQWQQGSRGAFNVSSRRLSNEWASAATNGRRPSDDVLGSLVDEMSIAPYRFDDQQLVQVRDCGGVDLNAIAKGFIVDLAFEAAWHGCDLDGLTVSAGGDLKHRGPVPVQVGIEDPSTRLDNVPPLLAVDVHNVAIATSGSARRGVSVDGKWISHVLDPRTGLPANKSASVTIVAPTAITADVVATIVSVMEPDEGLRFVDSLNAAAPAARPTDYFHQTIDGPIECWIVDSHQQVHHTGLAERAEARDWPDPNKRRPNDRRLRYRPKDP